MNQKLIVLAIIVGLVAIGLFSQNILNTQAVITAQVTIKTNPSSCSVSVGGATKDSGTSGAVFTLISPTLPLSHPYTATISKTGYATKTISVFVLGSAPVSVSVTLTATTPPPPTTATLFIKTVPDSCTVQVSSYTQNSGTAGATFTLLKGTTYVITTSKSGYATKTQSVSLDSNTQLLITLTAGPTPPPNTFTLLVKTQPTSCTVQVSSYTQNSGTAGATFTLPKAVYTLTTSKDGYITKTQSVSLDSNTQLVVTLTVAPPPPTQYTATITVSTDVGSLPGASVTLGRASGTTDVSGAVSLKVIAGTYDLKVTAANYKDDVESLTVSADQQKYVYMIPTTIVTYDLSITVVSTDNKPIEGATVGVVHTGTSAIMVNAIETATTDEFGVAKLTSLVPGAISIKATKDGYSDATQSVVLDSSKPIMITMTPISPYEKGIPGFEGVIFIVALGIAMVIIYERRNKHA